MRRMRLTRRLCCLARACAVSRAYTRRVIRDAQHSDFGAILQLNAGSEHILSPLDEAKLARLHGAAALHWVVEDAGVAQAFLLALREGVDYDSVNYRWFAARYPSFLYIDRVVGLRSVSTRPSASPKWGASVPARRTSWSPCSARPPSPEGAVDATQCARCAHAAPWQACNKDKEPAGRRAGSRRR